MTKSALVPARRQFFRRAGQATLSATAVALLAGCASAMGKDEKAAMAAKSSDIDILNSARGAEFNAIAAYQVGAESGLLQKPVLAVLRQLSCASGINTMLICLCEGRWPRPFMGFWCGGSYRRSPIAATSASTRLDASRAASSTPSTARLSRWRSTATRAH